ncbi:hypothetical protein [Zunongwangia sp. HRR-M8]|uniref:hypothetical protein n=1 Tax=Zunongwangia sp. HRR-M8 TaxID=3015170 RepID=UPI0022DE0B1F|nr:hypothetical protein [Zunongwangia sp. HRR-M8]WBL23865.1 hypothetical protein PBT89_07850 [Zunongwangia sp. HRR-M8]
MKLKIGILIILLCQIAKAQQSEMSVNQNQYNSDFVANSELKEQFDTKIKSKKEFELIALPNTDGKISVFIKNNSSDTISISHQDFKIYILQEAMDENGIWKPIEYWESSDCGNSFGKIKIEPNGIIETKSTKYNGNFKTKIRFKLSENNKVYYSNSIIGNINPNKLILPTDFSFTWPLAIMENLGNKTPMELQKKVVFLEPNGMEAFNEFFEKSMSKKN